MIGYYEPYWDQPEELEHFGIKGMKWGIRRYQNKDGTLTEAGKKRKAEIVSKIQKYNKDVSEKREYASNYEVQAKGAKNYAAIANGYNKEAYDFGVYWNRMYSELASTNWQLANEYTRKADKLIEKTKKKYGDTFLSDIDDSIVGKGRPTVYMVPFKDGTSGILTNEDWEKQKQKEREERREKFLKQQEEWKKKQQKKS